MPHLADEFDAVRGDLIYGLDSARQDVIYTDPRLVSAKASGAWFMINDFNNNTILRSDTAKFYANPGDKTTLGDQVSAIMGGVSQDKKKTAAPFVDGLYKRYPPSGVGKIPASKLVGEGRGDEATLRRNKMIRRSCKFGIENLILNTPPGALIHFLLAGLDPVAAANRVEYDDKVPITFSEIRSVFRNWATYQARVKFYDDNYNLTPQPPWGQAPPEWRAYAIRRLKKIVEQARLAKLGTANVRLAAAEKILVNVAKPGDVTDLMDIVDAANALRTKSVTFKD